MGAPSLETKTTVEGSKFNVLGRLSRLAEVKPHRIRESPRVGVAGDERWFWSTLTALAR